jgi:hypothetical protein
MHKKEKKTSDGVGTSTGAQVSNLIFNIVYLFPFFVLVEVKLELLS